jgi:hypothetical protein
LGRGKGFPGGRVVLLEGAEGAVEGDGLFFWRGFGGVLGVWGTSEFSLARSGRDADDGDDGKKKLFLFLSPGSNAGQT